MLSLKARLKGALEGISSEGQTAAGALERVTREHVALREGLGTVEKVRAAPYTSAYGWAFVVEIALVVALELD